MRTFHFSFGGQAVHLSLTNSIETTAHHLSLKLLMLWVLSMGLQGLPMQAQLVGAQQLLGSHLEFKHDQLAQLEHGAVVARVLRPVKNEVAAVSAVRINVPQEFFIAQFKDIEHQKQGNAITHVKKFSEAVSLADVSELELTRQDVNDLRGCKPGQCKFKLSAAEMERLRSVDWSAPDAGQQAAVILRQELVNYVTDYLAAGNQRMLSYDDSSEPVRSGEEFRDMLESSADLNEVAPEFGAYLVHFPGAVPANVENFLYWSREKYDSRLKQLITVTHVSIYRRPERSPAALIASKQIYASHYFETSLGLSLLFPCDSAPNSFYLVYVSRSRIDVLRRWFAGLGRGQLMESVRTFMWQSMFETKRRMEAAYAGRQADAAPRVDSVRQSRSRVRH